MHSRHSSQTASKQPKTADRLQKTDLETYGVRFHLKANLVPILGCPRSYRLIPFDVAFSVFSVAEQNKDHRR